MLSTLANGDYWYYEWEDGGRGIVKADNSEEAERKVKESEFYYFHLYQNPKNLEM